MLSYDFWIMIEQPVLGSLIYSRTFFIFGSMLTFTVNEKTSKGKSLLEFAQKLHADEDEIRIRKFRKLTDEEMALPGKPAGEEQLEEWLSRPDTGKGISAEQLLARLGAS